MPALASQLQAPKICASPPAHAVLFRVDGG
jgi:hypothetical protein